MFSPCTNFSWKSRILLALIFNIFFTKSLQRDQISLELRINWKKDIWFVWIVHYSRLVWTNGSDYSKKKCNVIMKNFGFWWKICSVGNHEVLLQTLVKHKLLDQNGWNFDTKNVKVYSLRLDQFQIHNCYHFWVKA